MGSIRGDRGSNGLEFLGPPAGRTNYGVNGVNSLQGPIGGEGEGNWGCEQRAERIRIRMAREERLPR